MGHPERGYFGISGCQAALDGASDTLLCSRADGEFVPHLLASGEPVGGPDHELAGWTWWSETCLAAVEKATDTHVCSVAPDGAIAIYSIATPDEPFGVSRFDQLDDCIEALGVAP